MELLTLGALLGLAVGAFLGYSISASTNYNRGYDDGVSDTLAKFAGGKRK